jgi:PKD repeat protein
MLRFSQRYAIGLVLAGRVGLGAWGQSGSTAPPLELTLSVDPDRIFVKGVGTEPQEAEVTLALRSPAGERLPVDLVLAVDTSATTNLAQMTAIATAILDEAKPQDQVGLVSFSARAQLVVGLTTDRRAIEQGLRTLRNVGATAVGEGIFTAVNHLVDDGRAEATWAIVLLTDGRSNTGRTPLPQAQRAADNGVLIFTVGVGRNVDRAVMNEIARITRGEFYARFDDSVPRQIFKALERNISARNIRLQQTLPAELNYESASENPPTKLTQNANGTVTLEWTLDDLEFDSEWQSVYKVSGLREGTFSLNIRPSKLTYSDFRGKKIERDLPETRLRVRQVNRPPIANFDFTPINPSTHDVVSFIDQSSDPDGGIVSWVWDFGDGATSQQASPTHQYAADGTYTVTLTVTDADNASNTKSRSIKVETLRAVVKREIETYLPNDETLPQQTFSVTLTVQVQQRVIALGIEEIMPDAKWKVQVKDSGSAAYRMDTPTKHQWLFREDLQPGTVKTISYEVKLEKDARSGKISGKVSSSYPPFETMVTGESSVKIADKLPFRVILSRWDPSKTQPGAGAQPRSEETKDEPAELNLRLGDKLTQEQILTAVSWWMDETDEYFKRRAKETLNLQVMQELVAYWLTDASVHENLPPFK